MILYKFTSFKSKTK